MLKNPLILALQQITTWLDRNQIPYMLFGGIASSIYGNPRQTFDIDLKIAAESVEPIENFIEKLKLIAVIIPQDPLQFIRDTNVLPIEIYNIRIDIVFANLPFEINAINHSRTVNYQELVLKICTLEDLIIHKAISTRLKDWADIETLISCNSESIDWDYLLNYCEELSAFLCQPEIIEKIKQLKHDV